MNERKWKTGYFRIDTKFHTHPQSVLDGSLCALCRLVGSALGTDRAFLFMIASSRAGDRDNNMSHCDKTRYIDQEQLPVRYVFGIRKNGVHGDENDVDGVDEHHQQGEV